MIQNVASIDVGTHTARLLIVQVSPSAKHLRPLSRERAYIHLGEDFYRSRPHGIQPKAIQRALRVLKDFKHCMGSFKVQKLWAVGTGVIREADNQLPFLEQVERHTGIRLLPISGDEEARLTSKGVLHALSVDAVPFLIFDLGGGSTEFVYGHQGNMDVTSVPMGAVKLTQSCLHSDPPRETDIHELSRHIDQILENTRLGAIRQGVLPQVVVGTGGTVTTLAAMIHHVSSESVTPKRINGLRIRIEDLEDLFVRMKALGVKERTQLHHLDEARAEVILAGTWAVIKILQFFMVSEITVSFSDLLEGIVIDQMQGE